MSVKFGSGFTTQLKRTSDLLNYNGAFTVAGWVKLTANPGTQTFYNAVGTTDYIFHGFLAAGGPLTYIEDTFGIGDSGSAISTGTWYYLAATRAAGDFATLKFWIAAAADITSGPNDRNTKDAQTIMALGAFGGGAGNPTTGLFAYVRAWSKELDGAGLTAEMNSPTAVDTDSLYGDWPLVDDVADISGNGRDWTSVGTLTFDGDSPLATAISITLDTLALAGSVGDLTVVTVVSVLLDTLTISGIIEDLTITPGAAVLVLSALALTGSVENLAIAATVLVLLDSLTLAGSTPDLAVLPGTALVGLDTLILAGSIEDINILTGLILQVLFRGMYKGMYRGMR